MRYVVTYILILLFCLAAQSQSIRPKFRQFEKASGGYGWFVMSDVDSLGRWTDTLLFDGTYLLLAGDTVITSGNISSFGGVSGSGTLNYITKWTPDGSTLGDSHMYTSGSGNTTLNLVGDGANNNVISMTNSTFHNQIILDGGNNSHSEIYLDRGGTNRDASVIFRTAGSNAWEIGKIEAANHFYINKSGNVVIIEDGADANSIIIDPVGNIGHGVSNPAYRLDIHTGGLRMAGQSSAPTGAAGVFYHDSDDERAYHHDGVSYNKLAYEDELFAPGYGELYTEIATGTGDTITLSGGLTVTIIFESQGLSENVTLTDSTITLSRTGDYHITGKVEYVYTGASLPSGSCANTSFSIYVDDVFDTGGSSSSVGRNTADVNMSHIVPIDKRVALTQGEVLKIKAFGACTDHQIFIMRATFGVTWLGP